MTIILLCALYFIIRAAYKKSKRRATSDGREPPYELLSREQQTIIVDNRKVFVGCTFANADSLADELEKACDDGIDNLHHPC